MIFRLNDTTIEIPDDPREVLFSDGLAFDINHLNIERWITQAVKEETIETQSNYYLYLIAKSISEFTKVDFNQLLMWRVDELLDENGLLYPEILQNHLQPEVYERPQEVENSIMGLYKTIKGLLKLDLKPFTQENYVFPYKGKNYEVPYLVGTILGRKIFTQINLGQSVDILKIYQYFSRIPKTYQPDPQDTKNKLFKYYLQIISILALEEGTEYPDSPEEALEYVSRQMVHFKDIDYHTANQITFFLSSSIIP